MRSKIHAQVFAVLSLLVALSVASCSGIPGGSTQQSVPRAQSQVQPTVETGAYMGMAAPNFSASTIDGGTFTLADQRGKPTILFFLANWCGSCVPEAKALGELQKEYGDRVSIAAIDIEPSSTPESLGEFKRLAGDPPLTWVLDPGQKVTKIYQLRALDTTLVIDREGIVVYRDEVPTRYETLKQELMKVQP